MRLAFDGNWNSASIRMMQIVMASSEMSPFAKTGGLGDVLGALPYSLAARGHDLIVFIPYYLKLSGITGSKPMLLLESRLVLGDRFVAFSVYRISSLNGVHVYAIRKEEFFDRPAFYGPPNRDYEDNADRFIFFSKAVLHTLHSLGIRPQIIHTHDWQTGLIPLFHSAQAQHGIVTRSRTVHTIHNLAYQGVFEPKAFGLTNLSSGYFNPNSLEFFGRMNCMKAGILSADAVTTVSARYAKEIQEPEYGFGLDGVIRNRASSLYGITNGVNYSQWDASSDPALNHHFTAVNIQGKLSCKKDLLEETGIGNGNAKAPVYGMVTRFALQKGIEVVLEAMSAVLQTGARLIVLGSGDTKYENAFRDVAAANPKQVFVKIGFDEAFARRIFAGADFFLMPSIYEPCGLSQLYAMRYGTLPIVRATGGLEDTVEAWDPAQKKGSGFKFQEASAEAFLKAFSDAQDAYNKPTMLKALRRNAMSVDFSWEQSCVRYENLYNQLLQHHHA
jgi:starch synthase